MKPTPKLPTCLMQEVEDALLLIFDTSIHPRTRVQSMVSDDHRRLYVTSTQSGRDEAVQVLWEFKIPADLSGRDIRIECRDGQEWIYIPKLRAEMHAS